MSPPRLPPLVFQCSSGCKDVLDQAKKDHLEKLFDNLMMDWMVCTIFNGEDESLMRQYLLKPECRLEIANHRAFLVRKVSQLWPMLHDGICIAMHLNFDRYGLVCAILGSRCCRWKAIRWKG